MFGGLHYITRKIKPVISGQVVKKKHGFLKYIAIGAFYIGSACSWGVDHYPLRS